MRAIINTCRTLTPTQALVAVVVWLMIIIGASQAIITSGDPAPCTPQPHVMFNTCATLDTTQVQDRRTHTEAPTMAPPVAAAPTEAPTMGAPHTAPTEAPPVAPTSDQAPTMAPTMAPTEAPATDNGYGADPVTPAPMPHCANEDGSGAGQAFPCQWDGATDGNGTGDSYVLTGAL